MFMSTAPSALSFWCSFCFITICIIALSYFAYVCVKTRVLCDQCDKDMT